MVVDEIRRYMEAAVGKLSPKKAQHLARSLMQGQGKDQIAKAAQDLMDWSNKNRERLLDLVRTEVRTQLKQVGVASRDEVDALRRRVRDLEKAQGAGKAAAAKRPAAKRSTAKRPAAKRSTAEARAARPPAAAAESATPATA
jgi:polyhydroxyalkanoate synthesis regulator phasin